MGRHPYQSWLSGAAVLSGLLLADATCHVRMPGLVVNVEDDTVRVNVPGLNLDIQSGRIVLDGQSLHIELND